MNDWEELMQGEAGDGDDAPQGEAAAEAASKHVCQIAMEDRKLCGRRIHPAPDGVDEAPVCLMHSHDPAKAEPDLGGRFQREIDRILDAAEKREGKADFSGFVFFECDYGGRGFPVACWFGRATFTQHAYFGGAAFAQQADFGDATFTQEANFQDATFCQAAIFGGAKFAQDADFLGATFTRLAGFWGATFSQGARFWGATFAQLASFWGATFAQDANFRGTTFTQDATFEDATFTQDANFVDASVAKIANFRRTKFLESVAFRETKFLQDAEGDPGPIFSLTEFSKPEQVVFYKTDLGRALFHNCDVTKMNFSSVTWAVRKGSHKWMVFEEFVSLKSEFARDLGPSSFDPRGRDYGLIAELYQQLKKNHDERKDYWTAGDFHYGEMEMKRLATPHGRLRALRRWWHRQLSLIAWYKYASEYGENYRRPVVWLGGVLVLFACLFPLKGLRYGPANDADSVNAATAETFTYWRPPPPGEMYFRWHGKTYFRICNAECELLGDSALASIEVAAFQKDRMYEPAYRTGRLLILGETLLTSSLVALFLLAVRRQFRR